MYRNFKIATERTETTDRRNDRDTLPLSSVFSVASVAEKLPKA